MWSPPLYKIRIRTVSGLRPLVGQGKQKIPVVLPIYLRATPVTRDTSLLVSIKEGSGTQFGKVML